MKKQLPSAKLPLPEFRSEKAAADYFGSHSLADVWDQLPAAKSAKPAAHRHSEKSIRELACSRAKSSRLHHSDFVPDQIEAAKKIAAAKSVGYQTQLRMWIAEGIQREERTTRATFIQGPDNRTARPLIRRRSLHMINNNHPHRSLSRFQSQPQLLSQRVEETRTRRLRRRPASGTEGAPVSGTNSIEKSNLPLSPV